VTCLTPSLGHMEAPRVARGWTQAFPSPPSSFPRARRHCSAAAARRSLHRRQSVTGESNRRSLSHVCVAEPHLAAGELVPAIGPEGGGTEGISVKISKVLGSPVQEDSSLFCELV
jgi:hypothetical protein